MPKLFQDHLAVVPPPAPYLIMCITIHDSTNTAYWDISPAMAASISSIWVPVFRLLWNNGGLCTQLCILENDDLPLPKVLRYWELLLCRLGLVNTRATGRNGRCLIQKTQSHGRKPSTIIGWSRGAGGHGWPVRMIATSFITARLWSGQFPIDSPLESFEYVKPFYSSPYYIASHPDHSNIRLLRLHPWRPFPSLRATLVNVQLGIAKHHHAISYTWAKSKDIDKTLIIDGKSFATTQSTYDVLYQFSSMWRARTVWIDCLSINQSVNQDKSAQVQSMRHIYARASEGRVQLMSEAAFPPRATDIDSVGLLIRRVALFIIDLDPRAHEIVTFFKREVGLVDLGGPDSSTSLLIRGLLVLGSYKKWLQVSLWTCTTRIEKSAELHYLLQLQQFTRLNLCHRYRNTRMARRLVNMQLGFVLSFA